MGAYQGRICPPRPPRAPEGQHHCARHAHHVHLARHPHPAVRAPPFSPRPSCRHLMSLSSCFLTASRRRCSMLSQTLRTFLGSLVSIGRHGHQREAVLSALHSQIACSSVSPVGRASHCVAQDQVDTHMPLTTPRGAPNTCTEQSLWRATGAPKQEEDPALRVKQATQGRNPDGTGASRSAFRPLGVQRGHSFFVPRPGTLPRILHAEISGDTGRNPDDTGRARSAFRALAGSCFIPRPGLLQRIPHTEISGGQVDKKSQTSVLISCPTRNAITSSYSATRGFPPAQRKRRTATSRAARPCQKSSKKVSQEGPSPSSAPGLSHECQREKEADGTKGQKRTQTDGSPTCDRSRPRKRKTCLLPHGRGDPLSLPTPPELGFRVTREHLDAERQAALQSIHRALQGGETEAIPDLAAIRAVWNGPAPAVLAAPSTNP